MSHNEDNLSDYNSAVFNVVQEHFRYFGSGLYDEKALSEVVKSALSDHEEVLAEKLLGKVINLYRCVKFIEHTMPKGFITTNNSALGRLNAKFDIETIVAAAKIINQEREIDNLTVIPAGKYLTNEIPSYFTLGKACSIFSQYEKIYGCGHKVIFDCSKVIYVDPSVIALWVQFNKKYPGYFVLWNRPHIMDSLIKNILNEHTVETILPALHISNCINGSSYERIKLWISNILGQYYSAPNNSSNTPSELVAIELMNNVIDHAKSESGGVISGACFKKHKHIELTVIDLGETIPSTLSPLYPELNDSELIAKALEFGVSRRLGSHHNYGRGLDIIKSYALHDKSCALVIFSRYGFASITKAEVPHVRDMSYCFNGTVVKCSFSEDFVNQNIENPEGVSDLEF
jgi:hypothetical protein